VDVDGIAHGERRPTGTRPSAGYRAAVPGTGEAAIDRHPHLGAPRRPGVVRVDLHSHTMFSGDSTTTPDEIAVAVADTGIDVLCITDHHAVEGAVRLAHDLPCRVVVGEEVRSTHGEIIGLFLSEHVPAGLSPEDTAGRIRSQGGLVYVPHPFDPMRRNLRPEALDALVAAGLVDAIEGFNAKTSLRSLNARAVQYAARHGVPVGAGSDAHVPDAIGAAFCEMVDFDGPTSFLAALHDADLVGHHWDEPRRWSARIVPSAVKETPRVHTGGT
jgi:predicted metal-dependent phosphoesterase TrpH